jgi:hypothetical protein
MKESFVNLNSVKLVVASLSLALLSACGGGGSGSVSTGGVVYTHDQLASAFVDRAYGDAGIDATLVKSNTLQYDYIVVYDQDYKSYDAYYIGDYHVGDNVSDYITLHNSQNYYDLTDLGGNLYQDYYTGVTFEETSASSKDLQKVAALKQELTVQKSAKNLKAQFGLSDDRSREVARLAVQLAGTDKKSMTDKDYDGFSKELLGTSIGKFQAAMKAAKEGNAASMNSIIETAAQVNGVGPEHMNQIMNGLFSGQ